MEPITTTLLIIAACRGAKKIYKKLTETSDSSSESTSHQAATPSVAPPGRIITLIGATSVGKSSTANALLGREAFVADADHHTTRAVSETPYHNGYVLRDTPGLLDNVDYSVPIWHCVCESELVVFVCKGQLLRPEQEFFYEIAARQKAWDSASTPGGRPRRLALYVNMQDVKRATMRSADRATEMRCLTEQVAPVLPRGFIVSGAATPTTNFGTSSHDGCTVAELRTLISTIIAV